MTSKAEYLKKYLEPGIKKSKKKKKKAKSATSASKNSGFRIIDDEDVEIPVGGTKEQEKVEELAEDEDEPVVALTDAVGVDELKMMGKFKTDSWQTLDSKQKKQREENEKRRQRHDSSDDDELPSTSQISNSKRARHDSSENSSDLSPPRPDRRRYDSGSSASDISVPRRRGDCKGDSDSDISVERPPPQGSTHSKNRHMKQTKCFDIDSDGDLSPERNNSMNQKLKTPKQEPESPERNGKMRKTLSGATAGLQSAANLRHEARRLKDREERSFARIDSKVSGRDAATVFRDRGTGKRRDIKKEQQEKEEEAQKQKELEDKYKKWNRGVKQLREREEKMEEMAKEAVKPMARYRGDTDLEEYQKDIERTDDPMLDYMRKKKEKQTSHIAKYPKYNGPAPRPNRFGISPGYRWDGVDRSNGFEDKIVSTRNLRRADEDEAYKYIIGTYE